ncbi:unnamed protein product, partial [Discosporangium mesarthrocarpum]
MREGVALGQGQGEVLFRIDKDEFTTGISAMRTNLMRLMVGPSPEYEAAQRGLSKEGKGKGMDEAYGDNLGDEKRRRLVVDLQPPRFRRFSGLLRGPGTLAGHWEESDGKKRGERGGNRGGPGVGVGGRGGLERGGKGIGEELEQIYRNGLNEDQRSAVRKLVTAKDYALLLGMPGTGKTWTMAFTVRVLLARGASVLVTSYTHSAVDSLLLKLLEAGVPCLRVGRPAQVHPGIRPCCINHDGAVSTTAGYAELVANARVVGSTCLGTNHPLFSQRRFDYCVVDEAGQISQPAVLGALRCADVFVLVGDHYQLPPLVTSREALQAGMSESLFRRLCEAHPESLHSLTYQYRMSSDIMALCNALIYSGRLRCGNTMVEQQCLHLPHSEAIPEPAQDWGRGGGGNTMLSGSTARKVHESATTVQGGTPSQNREPWLREALDPERRVIFLDTDSIPGRTSLPPREKGPTAGREGGCHSGGFVGLEMRAA